MIKKEDFFCIDISLSGDEPVKSGISIIGGYFDSIIIIYLKVKIHGYYFEI